MRTALLIVLLVMVSASVASAQDRNVDVLPEYEISDHLMADGRKDGVAADKAEIFSYGAKRYEECVTKRRKDSWCDGVTEQYGIGTEKVFRIPKTNFECVEDLTGEKKVRNLLPRPNLGDLRYLYIRIATSSVESIDFYSLSIDDKTGKPMEVGWGTVDLEFILGSDRRSLRFSRDDDFVIGFFKHHAMLNRKEAKGRNDEILPLLKRSSLVRITVHDKNGKLIKNADLPLNGLSATLRLCGLLT